MVVRKPCSTGELPLFRAATFCVRWSSLKQPAEETPSPSPEGVRAIKAAHALWDELAKVIPLSAISEHGKLKAIVVMQERLLSFSADSLD